MLVKSSMKILKFTNHGHLLLLKYNSTTWQTKGNHMTLTCLSSWPKEGWPIKVHFSGAMFQLWMIMNLVFSVQYLKSLYFNSPFKIALKLITQSLTTWGSDTYQYFLWFESHFENRFASKSTIFMELPMNVLILLTLYWRLVIIKYTFTSKALIYTNIFHTHFVTYFFTNILYLY